MPATNRRRGGPAAPRERARPTSPSTDTADQVVIGPQPGPQTQFFESPADIVIYGGQAGGGKSWALIYEGLRHAQNPDFGYVIFRRTTVQIRNQGGLWDESMKVYPLAGARPREGTLDWFFPSGAWVGMAHLEHENTKLDHQGAQYSAIGFDELTHFTESQFFYMLSRLRSRAGVPGYVRCTTNPDPDSWVAEFIAWWIDQEEESPSYGLPIEGRQGRVRWFLRVNDELHWADTRAELEERFEGVVPPEDLLPMSVTFIPAKLSDNAAMMKAQPRYRANLNALPFVERMRLLGGNWKVRASKGKVFPRSGWRIVPGIPKGPMRWVRYWDKAGTSYDTAQAKKDHTAGVLMGYHLTEKLWYVKDVVRGQWEEAEREAVIRQTAELDGPEVMVYVEQEPGSGGKDSARASVKNLRGHAVRIHKVGRSDGDKLVRANPLAAQQQVGNVCLVKPPGGGLWIPAYVAEMEAFPTKGIPDDQVDGSSGAFNRLEDAPSWSSAKDWKTVRK
jgi:predicted phage terminase large subunit-like protein